MAVMSLGIYTFAHNPSGMTLLKLRRVINPAETLGGVEFFSFGCFYAGQKVTVKWNYCPVATWAQLESLEATDVYQAFTPGDGHVYNVQILSLNGEYLRDTDTGQTWRKNVELVLMIESLVS
jgi:hypothetical protein